MSRHSVVCVFLSVDHDREPCKMAEPIEMPFIFWGRGADSRIGSRNRPLDEYTGGRHLANTIERSKTATMRPFATLL